MSVIRNIALTAVLCFAAHAQEFRASISGVVLDPSGSAIPGAGLAATNVNTGIRTTTIAGADGSYALVQLPPAQYELSAEAAGFRALHPQGHHAQRGR